MKITESKLRRIIRQVIKESNEAELSCDDVRIIVDQSFIRITDLSEFCQVLAMSLTDSGCSISNIEVEKLVESMLEMMPGKGIEYLSGDEIALQRSYLDELSMRREELSIELCEHCGIHY